MQLKAIRCRSTERKMSSQQNIARAPARARASCRARRQPPALRVRKGATAMRWERGNAPIVHATHGNSSCKRELLGAPACLCVGCLPPPPARASPVGVHGRPPARIRPPKLAPAPSNAHEQPYPPTPQKKIRAKAKAATITRAPWPRAPNPHVHLLLNGRGPAARKRLDAGARTCRGSTCIARTPHPAAAKFEKTDWINVW